MQLLDDSKASFLQKGSLLNRHQILILVIYLLLVQVICYPQYKAMLPATYLPYTNFMFQAALLVTLVCAFIFFPFVLMGLPGFVILIIIYYCLTPLWQLMNAWWNPDLDWTHEQVWLFHAWCYSLAGFITWCLGVLFYKKQLAKESAAAALNDLEEELDLRD